MLDVTPSRVCELKSEEIAERKRTIGHTLTGV